MTPSVSRVPPPPLLDLALPSEPLLEERERHAIHDVKFLNPTYGSARVVGSNSHIRPDLIITNANALQRLVDLLQTVHTEMEDDIARIKLAIGETREEIELFRTERANKTSGYDAAKTVHA